MPEIIREWAGYNGKITEEKKPDGTKKKTRHNKIWAVALTDTGHVYVRYGPAKHPLKLTEQIIRPKRGLSEGEALSEAEQIFQEKVQEKLSQKGYDAIRFETSPHFVPSFSKWRMSDEPEEVVVPVYEVVTPPDASPEKPLQEVLHDLNQLLLEQPCLQCHTLHQRYVMDIGDGRMYAPETLLGKLQQTEQGLLWLTVPCLQSENALLQVDTRELLVRVIDCSTNDSSDCAFKNAWKT